MKRCHLDGWFFLDKPIGVTSNFVLQKIRKVFNNCKAGFVGTLDPLASGFLPIALGSATKIISYIEKADKKYLFTVEWGVKTDTGDSEGKIIKKSNVFPSVEEIENKLKNFSGHLEQSTPKFSSVKINGFRAYELARKNIPFKTKNRKIFIKKIKLVKRISEKKTVFFVECSSGTYIRSLAESIAESLNTVGSLTELRRTEFGECNKKLISLDYLLSLVHSDDQNKLVQPIDVIFNKIGQVELSDEQVKKVLTGNMIKINENLTEANLNNLVLAKHNDKFVSLGLVNKSGFHPRKLLIT